MVKAEVRDFISGYGLLIQEIRFLKSWKSVAYIKDNVYLERDLYKKILFFMHNKLISTKKKPTTTTKETNKKQLTPVL